MKKNFDSAFCGSLPLQHINSIQPYGYLLVLEKQSLKIAQVSLNIENILNSTPQAILGRDLADYIKPGQLELLKARIGEGITEKLPFTWTLTAGGQQNDFLSIVIPKDDYLLVELEQQTAGNRDYSFLGTYQDIKYVMAAVQAAKTTEEVCNTALRELKKLSGFDRIMIYQFDEDWNGTVLAETLEEGMEPYLGLRFPASDIPKQARALYHRNPYRLIPDRDYAPVKLYPVINPVTQEFLDLSDCNLRSVPAVHLEYLKNMSVTASMSTRILRGTQLWGLISCHHREAKFLPYEMCSVFEILSGIIASRLSDLQNEEDFSYRSSLQGIQGQLVEHIYRKNSLSRGLLDGPADVLQLLNASGVAVVYNKNIETKGDTPGISYIKDLVLWLTTRGVDRILSIDSIAEVYEGGNQPDGISGMIVLPIHAEKGEFILGFRPEVVREVSWGGNPDEAINFEENSRNYHPRNSFKLWQQTVRNTSLPWHEQEIAIAEQLRNIILEFSLKRTYA